MSRASKSVVILLSGGLDSSANLALAVERAQVALAVTVDYGQRAAKAEVRAARRLCEHYGVPHRVLRQEWLGELGGSSLTDQGSAVPAIASVDLDTIAVTAGTARAVWVPNRNGVLIHAAAAIAERMGADAVVVGFNREEATTFPDNSRAYLEAVTLALSYSTANQVKVISYTVDMDKKEIVRTLDVGLSRPFPWDLIWSCYQGGDYPCGECESCRRLQRALVLRGAEALKKE